MQKLSLISFDPDPLPSHAEVMSAIGSFSQLLYQSLEAGASVCRRYYHELCEGEVPEPHLREMIVRARAKHYLTQSGVKVKVVRELGFSLAVEPLMSLLVHCNGFAIRVLKAKRGLVPGCGRSTRRKNFYNQVPVSYLDDNNQAAHSTTNLLVLWDFSPTFGIGSVWLACPQLAGSRSQDVVLAWQESVPCPVMQDMPQTETPADAAQRNREADDEIAALLVEKKSTDSSANEA